MAEQASAAQIALQKAFADGQVYLNQPAILTLGGPLLQWAGVMSVALPPPFGTVAASALMATNEAVAAVRNLFKAAGQGAMMYLPVNVHDKVIARLADAPNSLVEAAAKDKLAQWATQHGWPHDRVALTAVGFDCAQTGRFVDKVYKIAMDEGAQPWQAAAMAVHICWPMAVNPAGIARGHNYIDQVAGKAGAWGVAGSSYIKYWQERVKANGGVLVDANQAKWLVATAPPAGGSGAAILAVAAAVAAALAFH